MADEIWHDSEGVEWRNRGGFNWITGIDVSKKVPKTPEQEEEIEAFLKQYDEQRAHKLISVTPAQEGDILGKFLQETANLITFRAIIEKSSGKEVKFKD